MNPLMTSGAIGTDRRHDGTALSVNLNKVALLRNSRTLTIPSVCRAAVLALDAGAHGITVHPRPDQRHIRPGDVDELSRLLAGRPQAEFNIEGNPFHNLMDLLRNLAADGRCPQQVTFVPDSVEQSTSDHGWQMPQDAARLAPLIEEARALGARVSLFMDPEPVAMAAVAGLGADRVELYTEAYARSHGTAEQANCLARYVDAAQAATSAGLGLNAGHDLNRDNLADFLRAIPAVQEVSIGHALIADALEFGIAQTVREYLQCFVAAAGTPRR
ncbi:pyridoxine 5'-phosphate synthase [Piscinibacter sakaiensis]|uniref:pyridoxine 5'-phosphate synthase n=1 Tax=Piscinibacter sakaiensis TaxID=1547922 RepID=UPI003AACD760